METKQKCPLRNDNWCDTNCAWYCPDTGECAVKKISTELIKLMGE